MGLVESFYWHKHQDLPTGGFWTSRITSKRGECTDTDHPGSMESIDHFDLQGEGGCRISFAQILGGVEVLR